MGWVRYEPDSIRMSSAVRGLLNHLFFFYTYLLKITASWSVVDDSWILDWSVFSQALLKRCCIVGSSRNIPFQGELLALRAASVLSCPILTLCIEGMLKSFERNIITKFGVPNKHQHKLVWLHFVYELNRRESRLNVRLWLAKLSEDQKHANPGQKSGMPSSIWEIFFSAVKYTPMK